MDITARVIATDTTVPKSSAAAANRLWSLQQGEGPLLGLAVHSGHEIRPELLPKLSIDSTTRLREEDPYADYWAKACGTQLLTLRSRFEVDLNRRRSEAVYRSPADAWGLAVWTEPLNAEMIDRSLAEHDAFYERLKRLLRDLRRRDGKFIVFDLHSYNHRRAGPDQPSADPTANPDVNLGTGSMNRTRWATVVERFMDDLSAFDFLGRRLDVRENVNFRGRYVAEFVHTNFPDDGCVLAIEVKKFFMDEWTGAADPRQVKALLAAFQSTVPGLMEELSRS